MATDKDENKEGDLFIREVDEDLRADRQAELWKKYGNYVIGVAVGIVLIVAGYQGWNAYERNQKEELAERFNAATALVKAQKLDEGQKALASLANDGPAGYKVLARLQEAAVLAKKGDGAAAAAVYWELADDTSVNQLYRGLAVILGALNGADEIGADRLKQRLAPLTNEQNPWRHSARELTAVVEMKTGSRDKALEIYKKLSEDATSPQGVRTRAKQLVTILSN